jgi:hypothetical protein
VAPSASRVPNLHFVELALPFTRHFLQQVSIAALGRASGSGMCVRLFLGEGVGERCAHFGGSVAPPIEDALTGNVCAGQPEPSCRERVPWMHNAGSKGCEGGFIFLENLSHGGGLSSE